MAINQHSRFIGDKVEFVDNLYNPPKIRSLALVVEPRDASTVSSNMIEVWLFDENGVKRATLIRFKLTDSGSRIAADFPACDGNYVIVDASGHITNG